MAISEDIRTRHEAVVDTILESFSHRNMVVTKRTSDNETTLDDMFVYATVTTLEDGYQLRVVNENQQPLFDDSEYRFETPSAVASAIALCYEKIS